MVGHGPQKPLTNIPIAVPTKVSSLSTYGLTQNICNYFTTVYDHTGRTKDKSFQQLFHYCVSYRKNKWVSNNCFTQHALSNQTTAFSLWSIQGYLLQLGLNAFSLITFPQDNKAGDTNSNIIQVRIITKCGSMQNPIKQVTISLEKIHVIYRPPNKKEEYKKDGIIISHVFSTQKVWTSLNVHPDRCLHLVPCEP